MIYSILKFLITIVFIMIIGTILPGIKIRGGSFWTAFVVAVVIAGLNFFVYPVMLILTIPITIITFGLFLLILNAFNVKMATWIVPNFEVSNFWSAILFSILLSINTYVLEMFLLPFHNEIFTVGM